MSGTDVDQEVPTVVRVKLRNLRGDALQRARDIVGGPVAGGL
jgi:hypothetical protein